MKVESLTIRNFKRFEELDVSFKNQVIDEVSNRYLILGDNGTGKTTILQAIALTLGMATRSIKSITDFDWIGFVPGRYSRWGRPHIELTVLFSDSELKATREIADEWNESRSQEDRDNHPYIQPGMSNRVKLTLDGEKCNASTRQETLQFQGRNYAQRLLETNPSIRSRFSDLPGIFWFDQFRNLASPTPQSNGFVDGQQTTHDVRSSSARLAYEVGVAKLRQYLNGWKLSQLSGKTYSLDYLLQLENLYKRVFPGRSFAGVEPMPGRELETTSADFYFLLNDGSKTYDLVEMSAGEQAVFPILYEFVRQQIHHSVVLIDEIDLNLHPSTAQQLVSQMSVLGKECQFVFTTHSSAVSSVIGEENTYRLPGSVL